MIISFNARERSTATVDAFDRETSAHSLLQGHPQRSGRPQQGRRLRPISGPKTRRRGTLESLGCHTVDNIAIDTALQVAW